MLKYIKKIKYLLISVILFIAATLFSNYFFKKQEAVNIVDKIQNSILQKEQQLYKTVDSLLYLITNNSNNVFDYINECENKNIFIAIYDTKYIKFWNSNRIEFSQTIDSIFIKSKFLVLKNGYFLCNYKKLDSLNIVALSLIKNNYQYQNQYLINSFQLNFSVLNNIEISHKKNIYNIYNRSSQFLFSIILNSNKENKNLISLIIIVLYLFAVFYLIFYIINLLKVINTKYKIIVFLLSFVFLLFLRLITFYFKIPFSIYNSEIFSPIFYASSTLLPSLGDLFLNIILALFIYIFLVNNYNIYKPYFAKIFHFHLLVRLFISIVIMLLTLIVFMIAHYIFKSLIINSSISLSLDNIISFNYLSYIVYFVIAIIHIIIITFFYFSLKTIFYLLNNKYLSATLIILFLFILFLVIDIEFLIFILSLFIIIIFFLRYAINIVNIKFVFLLLLVSSSYTVYFINSQYNLKEKDNRILLSNKLIIQNDPITELNLFELAEQIETDKIIFEYISYQKLNELKIIEYINKKYITNSFSKYKSTITICFSSQLINIQPENYNIECIEFFNNKIENIAKATNFNNIWRMYYNQNTLNYLLKIELLNNEKKQFYIFIEIDSKSILNSSGYIELLQSNKSKNEIFDLSNYSFARYIKGKLTNQYGKHYYNANSTYYKNISERNNFFNLDGFNHFITENENGEIFIISKKNISFINEISSVSFFIIFYGIILILLLIVLNKFKLIGINKLSFQAQLQVFITIIIIISLLAICIITIYYFVSLNNKKNTDVITEKAHSIMIQFEEKFFKVNNFDSQLNSELNKMVVDLSQINFIDINLFNSKGFLMSTSRPQIINDGLISNLMQPIPYYELKYNNKTIITQNEYIGELKYWSIYMPLRNEKGKILAYLNIPYFSKQNELKKEISSFVIAFLSVYVLIIFIILLISLFISNIITKPLKLLKASIGTLKLGGKNDTIKWNSKDEIGELVSEYNRMVEELKNSAELLASSQRDLAWREMAQQVAHEIKNPLTPMKLSVQMLKRAWDDNSPEFSERVKSFSKTLIEQIDTLSDIATSFSHFAKMPQSNFAKENLFEIIKSVANLYNEQNININFNNNNITIAEVYVDKNQIIRVFNNLIKNSIQSFDNFVNGKITINLIDIDNYFIIEVIDNGCGIDDDIKYKIFSPNFTTKTSGMGLGLAMVYNIISNLGGEISFESEINKGTTFSIKLPKVSKED